MVSWPTDIDRLALCVHRPSGRDPRVRAAIDRIEIPAGSFYVVAARHLANGLVTDRQLELLQRFESRTLVRMTIDHHLERGLVTAAGEGSYAPSPAFRDAASLVLSVQAEAAASLWDEHPVDQLAADASAVVNAALADTPIADGAFQSEHADRSAFPRSSAASLVAAITELRYLRADLHADALAGEGLSGPRARAVHKLWLGHPVPDEDLDRLKRATLVVKGPEGWRLTDEAVEARERAEARTNELTDLALAGVRTLWEDFTSRLPALPGEDPRPAEDR